MVGVKSKKKRNHDVRRIRLRHSYTVKEVARLLEVCEETVRRWVKVGLPVFDEMKPLLIVGADLKRWLNSRRILAKKPCLSNEFYCLSCRAPRMPTPGTLSIHPRNEKTIFLKAKCGVCGARINRVWSASKIADIAVTFATPEL
ncbi:MAG: helix-turn-helix domain-containing protein [bacterium]|nr:helix-turn-helix domain-containing protein [bacterium]